MKKATKGRKSQGATRKFKCEKKFIAQVRFYEVLYKIRDDHGEVVYTGNEETAKKVLKLLNDSKRKSRHE